MSDGRNSSSVTVFEGHLSYINECVVEPVSGMDAASVSGEGLILYRSFPGLG